MFFCMTCKQILVFLSVINKLPFSMLHLFLFIKVLLKMVIDVFQL